MSKPIIVVDDDSDGDDESYDPFSIDTIDDISSVNKDKSRKQSPTRRKRTSTGNNLRKKLLERQKMIRKRNIITIDDDDDDDDDDYVEEEAKASPKKKAKTNEKKKKSNKKNNKTTPTKAKTSKKTKTNRKEEEQKEQQQKNNDDKKDVKTTKKKPQRKPREKLTNLSECIPVMLPNTATSMVLAELHDESVNLSGDTGVVGRIKLPSNNSGTNNCVTVDLKGRLYMGNVKQSSSILLMGIQGKVARIESIVDNILPLKFVQSIHDAEMIEGELDEQNFEDIDANVND